MKKLIFIFLILFVLVVITGCNLHKNTVSFNPSEGDSTEVENVEGKVTTEDIKLAVTSIIGDSIDTNVDHHVIKGLTPSNTKKLKINDYTLQKYVPGSTDWSYIASSSYGTLSEGENTYTIRAYDEDEKELGAYDFTIVYTAPEIPNLPSVGTGTWMILIISMMISTLLFGFKRLKTVFIKD